MTYNPAAGKTYTLAASIGSTDSTILLSSFLDAATGVAITMATMNTDIAYATISPKTSSSEFISFTGITQNADGTALLTGVVRGLNKQYPFTSNASYKFPHSGQSVFILSDAPQVFAEYSVIENDETITGLKTFTQFPITPSSAPTSDYQVANKKYIDDTAIAGSPKATDSVYGILKLSTAAVSPTDPIAVGNNDTRVPTQGENDAMVGNNTDVAVGTGNKFVTQTGLQHNAEKYAADNQANDTYVITLSPVPTSYTNGMVVYFYAKTANTGAATLNVNGLGAKTIVKEKDTTLANGDIKAGQLVSVIYDGTNFQMLSPVGNAPQPTLVINNGVTSRSFSTASGSQTIAHGLGKVPKKVKITALFVNSNSFGSYNGTNTDCVYTSFNLNGAVQGISSSSTRVVYIDYGSNHADIQEATIAVDSTNITLSWTKTGTDTSGTINIMWEAIA